MQESVAELGEGREDLNAIIRSLDDIASIAAAGADKVGVISEAARDQLKGSADMVQAMDHISDVATSNASSTEQVRKVIGEQTAAVAQMAERRPGAHQPLPRAAERSSRGSASPVRPWTPTRATSSSASAPSASPCPLEAVREVVPARAPLRPACRAPRPAVRGAMNLRGRVVAVVDLAPLLGLAARSRCGDGSGQVLMLDRGGGRWGSSSAGCWGSSRARAARPAPAKDPVQGARHGAGAGGGASTRGPVRRPPRRCSAALSGGTRTG